MNEHQSYYNNTYQTCVCEECTENCFRYDPLFFFLFLSLTHTITHKMCVFIHGPTPMRALRVCNFSFMVHHTHVGSVHTYTVGEDLCRNFNSFRSIPVCNKSDSVDANDVMDIPALLDFLNSNHWCDNECEQNHEYYEKRPTSPPRVGIVFSNRILVSENVSSLKASGHDVAWFLSEHTLSHRMSIDDSEMS